MNIRCKSLDRNVKNNRKAIFLAGFAGICGSFQGVVTRSVLADPNKEVTARNSENKATTRARPACQALRVAHRSTPADKPVNQRILIARAGRRAYAARSPLRGGFRLHTASTIGNRF
jgi:hypothetical protein